MADWRITQKNAQRSIIARIANNSTRTLVRTNYSLASGVWSCIPPERIMPKTISEFGSQSSGLLKGTVGFVMYKVEDGAASGVFEFHWHNGYWGRRECRGRGPAEFDIVESTHMGALCDLTWVIEDSNQPRRKSQETKRANGTVVSTSRVSTNTSGTNGKVTVPPTIETEWMTAIGRAFRSAHIVIDNRTECTLVRRDLDILYGEWALFPPEAVAPFSVAEFGALSNVLWLGCQGNASYNIIVPSPQDSSIPKSSIRTSSGNFLRGDLSIKWNIPVMGSRYWDSRVAPPLRVEMDCTGGSRCKIIFCIMQPQVQVGNMLTAAPMRLHVRKVDSFKLLSLNTMILPPVISATDPNSRAKKLAAKFIAENYDIICLQEVMYTPARQVLFDALQHEYPYATTRTSSKLTINLGTHDQAGLLRVGKDSGVLVASKFPLLRTEFRLFPSSGYGTDKMVQKGILACKVDLSSISPNKSLWIFSTHLQSNPDGGLVWRLHGDAVKKTRDARLKQMELINSFMSECIRSDEADRRRPEDVGIVLCGDFNITGEQGHDEGKDLRHRILTEKLPNLASQINSKIIRVSDSCHLIEHLHAMDVPITYLGYLRQLLISPRDRLVVLITMLGQTIRQGLIERLRLIESQRVTMSRLRTSLDLNRQSPKGSPTSLFLPTTLASSATRSDDPPLTEEEEEEDMEPIQQIFLELAMKVYCDVFAASSPAAAALLMQADNPHEHLHQRTISSPISISSSHSAPSPQVPVLQRSKSLPTDVHHPSPSHQTPPTPPMSAGYPREPLYPIIDDDESVDDDSGATTPLSGVSTPAEPGGVAAPPSAASLEFWREAVHKMIATFDGGGLDEEFKTPAGASWVSQAHLLRFQLVKAVEMATGVPLSLGTKQQVIRGEMLAPDSTMTLSTEHVGAIDWTATDLPVNCFTKMTPMEASIEEHDVEPTEEYCDMLSAFANPRDLYREKNRLLAGYTVDSVHNSLVKSKGAKRIDYIFAFDTLGTGFDVKTMLQLQCKDCKVKPTGDSAVSQLSDHFGVEASLSLM